MTTLSEKRLVLIIRWLYPIWVVLGIFSLLYIPGKFASEDPQLAMEMISSDPFLFRLGVVGRLLTHLMFILIPYLLFELFQKTSRRAAGLMLVWALVSIPISMYSEVQKWLVLDVIPDVEAVSQLLAVYAKGLSLSTIFWGLWLFPLGYLVIKSKGFPKFIGWALYLAGVGYVVGAFLPILFPDSQELSSLFEYLTFGEMIFIFWFVIRGMRIE